MAALSQTQIDGIVKSLQSGGTIGAAYQSVGLNWGAADAGQVTQINTALDFGNTGNFVGLTLGDSQTIKSPTTTTTTDPNTSTTSGSTGGTATHPSGLDGLTLHRLMRAGWDISTLTNSTLGQQAVSAWKAGQPPPTTTGSGGTGTGGTTGTTGGTGSGTTGGSGGSLPANQTPILNFLNTQFGIAPTSLIADIQNNLMTGNVSSISYGNGTITMDASGNLQFNPPPAAPTPTITPVPGGTSGTGSFSGSANPLSPGSGGVITDVDSLGNTVVVGGAGAQTDIFGQAVGGPKEVGFGGSRLNNEQQLAAQQAELNRQQLEGALNERGIAESGRGELLRDIQGLQAELQIGQTIPEPGRGGPDQLARERFANGPQGPTQSPTGQPVRNPAMAFDPVGAPEISQLQEPDAFGDLRAALSESQAAASAQLGQGSPVDIGNRAMAQAARFATIMPGFGNTSLDPFAAIQAAKNGVGTGGRNLATPGQMFQIELDDRADSRRKNSQQLAGSVLQSWRRAESMQAQQQELLKQFNEMAGATGAEGSLHVQQRLMALRGDIEQMEKAKLSMVERVQDEYKRFTNNQDLQFAMIGTGKNVPKARLARAHSKHVDGMARQLARHLGEVESAPTAGNGLNSWQSIRAAYSPGEMEELLARIGRGEQIAGM